jgi:winged helix DNA-binding protein
VSTAAVLGQRALNRALLARQSLLRRDAAPAEAAIAHLVGMQAQAPLAPYVGLWSRIAGFHPGELATLLLERRVVRTWVMRSTIHLVTASDALALVPLLRPVVERAFRGTQFARDLAGVNLDELLATGRGLIEERPRTRAELAPILAERWPGVPPDSLVYALSYNLPVVQATPRGVWGRTGPSAVTTIDAWLGRPTEAEPDVSAIVLRYLGAFGPATVMDCQAWCGLTRLRPVFERLRPRLEAFRDEQGRELFDLPDAPRPDADVGAPMRFLPEYDNVLLGHADRTRIIPAGRRIPLPPGDGAARGTILVDGRLAGEWRIERSRDRSTAKLVVEPFVALAPAERTATEAEGLELLAFVAPGSVPEVDVRGPVT